MPDTPRTQRLREAAVEYLKSFLGLPYRWGGDDPMTGFDCSGLVIEVLTGVGILPHGYDNTAEGLWQRFRLTQVDWPYAGCLVLWLNSQAKATHVEMTIDDYHAIGASGGGSATTSDDAASAQNAFVKMRPYRYRGGSYKIVDPFKMVVG
jgi:cell wall-associated NlpC family hydrolase